MAQHSLHAWDEMRRDVSSSSSSSSPAMGHKSGPGSCSLGSAQTLAASWWFAGVWPWLQGHNAAMPRGPPALLPQPHVLQLQGSQVQDAQGTQGHWPCPHPEAVDPSPEPVSSNKNCSGSCCAWPMCSLAPGSCHGCSKGRCSACARGREELRVPG